MAHTAKAFLAIPLALGGIAGCNLVLGLDEYQDVHPTGGGLACSPGAEEECYTGPDGTKGVGVCKAGVKTCKDDGSGYGPCKGEITPRAEDCGTSEDDNCDGQENEACVCTPKTESACYDGPAGTEDKGICGGGMHTCDDDGKGYGPCVGEVTPKAESCEDNADEDCDGHDCVLWAKLFGDAAVQAASGVAVDAKGNIFVVGAISGGISEGSVDIGSAGGADVFVLKLDPTGKPLWGKAFGDASDQYAQSLAVDSLGDVVIGGRSDTSLSLGGPAVPAGLFLVKLGGNDGHHIWSTGFHGEDGCGNSEITAIKATLVNDFVITGSFCNAIDFGDGPLPAQAGSTDGFLAKVRGGDGSAKAADGYWGKAFSNGNSIQHPTGLAFGGFGDIIVVGYFSGGITFGPFDAHTSSGSSSDIFIAKIYNDGKSVLGSWHFGDGESQRASSVAAAPDGSYVVSGQFLGKVNFGVDGDLDAGSNLFFQPFVVKFDASDTPQWARAYVDATNMAAAGPSAVGIDKTGDILLSSSFNGTLDFGEGPLSSPVDAVDAFLVKLDAQGATRWSRQFANVTPTYYFLPPVSLTLSSVDEPVLAGLTQSTIDFGTGPLMLAGSADAFVAKFAP